MNTATRELRIDPLSATSLYLKLWVHNHQLSTATGFVVRHQERVFLLSNWHVFSGRNAETEELLSKKTGAAPDHVRIAHHMRSGLGRWHFKREPLYSPDGSPRWVEHPRGHDVDVAALELRDIPEDVQLYPLDLSMAEVDLETRPAMAVSVIGFPFGLRPNLFFPVWKTGHVATDPELPYRDGAAFLIDATTREGMSGSPVVQRVVGPKLGSSGFAMWSDVTTKFLGIYSGRIRDDAELGCVWHPHVIREVLASAVSKPAV